MPAPSYQSCPLAGFCASAGVSEAHDYDVNSLAVPRKAKEAIGAITKLTYPDGR